jgi:tetratricopeptide (TPR) repeat protein
VVESTELEQRRLAELLNASVFALWEPQYRKEQLCLAGEFVALAEKAEDAELFLVARMWRIVPLIELGEFPIATVEIDAVLDLANARGGPAYLWCAKSLKVLCALAEAQRQNGGEIPRSARAKLVSLLQQHARFPSCRCRLCLPLAPGADAEASEVSEAQVEHDEGKLRVDPLWSSAISTVTSAAACFEDAVLARSLYRVLLPLASDALESETLPDRYGSVSRWLGLLASRAGRWREAERHFEEALEVSSKRAGQPFLAYTQHGYAAALLVRSQPGDHERALALLGSVIEAYECLGLRRELEWALDLRARVRGRPGSEGAHGIVEIQQAAGRPHDSPLQAEQRLTEGNFFRREGDYWSIGYAGKMVHLEDAKGLSDIALLLRHSGREFHVLDLVAETEGRTPGAAAKYPRLMFSERDQAGMSSWERFPQGGALPNGRAVAEYRKRLEDLRERATEADEFGDAQRAAQARREIAFIEDDLASAYGLSGKAGELGRPAERARKAVGKRIRSAIHRLQILHPALGAHLSDAVKTGIFCSYSPREPVRWNLD